MEPTPCQNKQCECYDPRRADHCEIGPAMYCPDYRGEDEGQDTAAMPQFQRYGY
jgi:hypothetical protein